MADVSFLLPVHNGADFIAEAIASLLTQDHGDFDIHVIDDGSTDATPAILDRITDPRLITHTRPASGLVETLNYGLGQLDCRYVARMDADDISFPNRITSQLEFKAFTGAIAVSCRSLHMDVVGNVTGISGHHPLFSADPQWCPPREPYLPHPFLLADLEVMQSLGYRAAHHSEDADLCWRLSEAGPIALQLDVLGKYRLHAASVSTVSVARGRIQALYAGLAALNAQRRASGVDEVPYDKSHADCDAAAGSIETLVALYAPTLRKSEEQWLQAAAALKLVDLASWRGYVPARCDLASLRRAMRYVARQNPANLAEANRIYGSLRPVSEPCKVRLLVRRPFC